ncbi:hypothetical protein BGZ95_001707 [Linnemannia exigua]|uniref:Uncharacterized protein n=1 Tax=Linnemannia exigua TaxID=604196 RepID=A0AAD4DIV8_9FUNG|nr:hypothetical protein BGZ95_001707 [Linnemannia exigua]
MPMTLKDIEDYDRKDMLRVEHIHWAITNEVRNLKNWENALTLLTSYLAPVIIASEKAVAAAATAAAATPTAAAGDSNNTDKVATENTKSPSSSSPATTATAVVRGGGGGGGQLRTSTSKFSDFVEDETTGQFTKQLSEQDIRMIQYSVAALVRYAPTPSESNVVYMFYLQRQPPVRNDETIDNCLISLIYQYAQVKDDPELRAKGLDLIKVALERGVGLPSYQSRTSVKNQNYRQQRESILASVSKPILIQQGLQITQDGRALEARRPNSQYQQGRPFTQQNQQQQQGSQFSHKGFNGFPAGGQKQGQGQGQNQAQAQVQGQGQVASGRKSGRSAGSSPQPQSPQQQQQQQVPQQTQTQNQTQGKTKPRHRKQDSPRLANNDTQDTDSNTTTTTSSRQEDPLDQYEYYTKASRSFSGTERVNKSGSRPAFGGVGSGGSSGGKLRTIAFVPASNNPMLKTDHPAPSSTEEDSSQTGEDAATKDDVTAVLTEGVENLRLDQGSN